MDCDILEHIATLSYNNSSERKVQVVSWFGKEPKIDIRDWSTKDADRAYKGISLSFEEALLLLSHADEIREAITSHDPRFAEDDDDDFLSVEDDFEDDFE